MKKLLLSLITFCSIFAGDLKIDVLAKSTKSWDNSTLPKYNQGEVEVTILRIKIPPKTKLPIHKHPVINAGVLISGELNVITKDNKKLHLKAGDPIIETVETWHYGVNNGEVDADIIVFYAGILNQPITIKE